MTLHTLTDVCKAFGVNVADLENINLTLQKRASAWVWLA